MLANTITLTRTIITFGVIALFGRHPTLAIVLIFSIPVIFILDAVDGIVARKRNETTKIGALLDTIADRIIENTFWIYFSASGLLPLWMPITVMARGVIIDTLQKSFGYPQKRWIHALTRSRISRGLYGAVKMLTFMSLASATVFQRPVLGTRESEPREACSLLLSASRTPPLFHQEPLMSTKHLKSIVFISICVLFFVIFGFFGTRRVQTGILTQTKNETRIKTIFPVSPRVFRKPLSIQQADFPDFQQSDFYRTIIDNNLFRPLGWRLPRPKEPYRLLGTIIPKDGKSLPQAILQKTTGNKIHTVTHGDTLNTDTIITDIQAEQVTLEKAGQQRTLKLNPRPWLK